MIPRPAPFAGMAGAFTRALGNADAVFIIGGVALDPVRVLLRRERAIDLAEDAGFGVEGMVHTLAVDATAVPGIVSGRDTVTIAGSTYGIGNRLDDGRAMMRFLLDGDV